MDGAHTDPDRHFGELERTHPMNAGQMLEWEPLQCLGKDAGAFRHGQRLERFVFEPDDLLALVVIAHPSFETDVAACAAVAQLAARELGIDRGVRQTKRHHPPATGGMKTMASPGSS